MANIIPGVGIPNVPPNFTRKSVPEHLWKGHYAEQEHATIKAVHNAWKDNHWGTRNTHDGNATRAELDWVIVNEPRRSNFYRVYWWEMQEGGSINNPHPLIDRMSDRLLQSFRDYIENNGGVWSRGIMEVSNPVWGWPEYFDNRTSSNRPVNEGLEEEDEGEGEEEGNGEDKEEEEGNGEGNDNDNGNGDDSNNGNGPIIEPTPLPPPPPPPVPPCISSPTSLCLSNNRFRASILWADTQGNTGEGKSYLITPDTGAFTFFNDDNLEVVVKVIDGRTVNGYWWVFYASLTDVEFKLSVQDMITGRAVVYYNNQGNMASRGDTAAIRGVD